MTENSGNDLAQAFSAAIQALIHQGSYGRLYRHWFGADAGSEAHPLPAVSEQPLVPFPEVGDGPLAAVLERGSLRIGYGLMGPPFSSIVGDGVEGWDLDLAEALTMVIAHAYGRRLETLSMRLPAAPFPDRLFDELDRGRVDAVLSDLAITEGRLQRVDFSRPYLRATFGLLCPDAAGAERLNTLAAADRPRVKILVLRRAFLHELADRWLASAEHVLVDEPEDLVRGLRQGQGDAALLPHASIEECLRRDDGLACPGFCIGPGGLRAVAVAKQ